MVLGRARVGKSESGERLGPAASATAQCAADQRKPSQAKEQLTEAGAVMGTPAYMSPEQAAAKHDEIGPASDQYSLGAVLYELLCGERPFAGTAPGAMIAVVISQEPDSPK